MPCIWILKTKMFSKPTFFIILFFIYHMMKCILCSYLKDIYLIINMYPLETKWLTCSDHTQFGLTGSQTESRGKSHGETIKGAWSNFKCNYSESELKRFWISLKLKIRQISFCTAYLYQAQCYFKFCKF